MMFNQNRPQQQNMFNNGGQPSLGTGQQPRPPQSLSAYTSASPQAQFQQPQPSQYLQPQQPQAVGYAPNQSYTGNPQRPQMTRDRYMQRSAMQNRQGAMEHRRMMQERARRRQMQMMQQRQQQQQQFGRMPY